MRKLLKKAYRFIVLIVILVFGWCGQSKADSGFAWSIVQEVQVEAQYGWAHDGTFRTEEVYGEEQEIVGYYDKEICSGTSEIQWWEHWEDGPISGSTPHVFQECVEWETIQAPIKEHPVIGTVQVPNAELVQVSPATTRTIYPGIPPWVRVHREIARAQGKALLWIGYPHRKAQVVENHPQFLAKDLDELAARAIAGNAYCKQAIRRIPLARYLYDTYIDPETQQEVNVWRTVNYLTWDALGRPTPVEIRPAVARAGERLKLPTIAKLLEACE